MRDKYEAELRELEQSERVAVEKHQEVRRRQMEMEAELVRLQAMLRQKEEENEDITQVRRADLPCSLPCALLQLESIKEAV